MIRKRTAIIGALMLVIITVLGTTAIGNFRALRVGDNVIISRQLYEQMQGEHGGLGKLKYLKGFLLEGHYFELEEETLIDGALRGMFEAVDDPYTTFLDAKAFSDMMISTRGTYGGIGIIITADEEGFVSVVSPIEGTPGNRAGLTTGDRILQVDHQTVSGNRLDVAVSLMRGEPDTEVIIEVLKKNRQETKEVVITREIIKIESVRSEMKAEGVGYMRISSFDEQTGRDFKQHMDLLVKQGMNRLVLDLRNNPGGLLNQANYIADLLLDEGIIVYTENRHGHRREEKSGKQMFDVKLVVLINEGSASASEILAGAIQDHRRGLLVGSTSFGKGLVQELQRLPDGTGFKYTVSQYFTPSGRIIHGVGIEPDVVIEALEVDENMEAENVAAKDIQLKRAIELLSQ